MLILSTSIFYYFSQADIDKAVEAAQKAFQYDSLWRKMEPAARGNLIRKLADLLRRDVDYLAVRVVFQTCFLFSV
jgi:acyl-CoA reductase-like NAD-dependent aldehyde dehydrogenase